MLREELPELAFLTRDARKRELASRLGFTDLRNPPLRAAERRCR
jgi:hypothetical protein